MAVRRLGSPVGLGLAALALISLPACNQQKKRELASAKAAASQSLGEFKIQIDKLQAATSGVRARFEALPDDMQGLEAVHSDLFVVEEVLGVEGARVKWLSGELDKAAAAGSKEQVQKASDMIRNALEGNKEIDKRILKLTHQLLPFERMASQRRALTAKPDQGTAR